VEVRERLGTALTVLGYTLLSGLAMLPTFLRGPQFIDLVWGVSLGAIPLIFGAVVLALYVLYLLSRYPDARQAFWPYLRSLGGENLIHAGPAVLFALTVANHAYQDGVSNIKWPSGDLMFNSHLALVIAGTVGLGYLALEVYLYRKSRSPES